ncbi:MAG: hypothetical protein KKB37_16065 [Alphaproteobacteria bacterium]|nr:hypothetical protein [Alphaproteobacteria bacterium]
MIDPTTLEGKVIAAAFSLAASPGWAEVSLRDIADAAGCPLDEVMDRFDDKDDVIRVFIDKVDRVMLSKAGEVEREQTTRDALFEVIMSRFDVMAPYRSGLKSIIGDRLNSMTIDPGMIGVALKTQNRIMQAAGISAAGAPALIRRLGLAQLYAQVFRVWLDDDDPGMARTMAALDRRLRQGEQTLRTIDDITGASGRMCEQAADLASRFVGALRRAATSPGAQDEKSSEEDAAGANGNGTANGNGGANDNDGTGEPLPPLEPDDLPPGGQPAS